MQEKAKARELQRKAGEAKKTTTGDAIKIGSVYTSKRKQPRKPRSMLQIRESLKQMMEAEVIGKINLNFIQVKTVHATYMLIYNLKFIDKNFEFYLKNILNATYMS
jgi:hypothetical protein